MQRNFDQKFQILLEMKIVFLQTHVLLQITIAMKIAGVGPGTEVITTPISCIAGNQPILMLGAIPVWADVSRRNWYGN